MNEKEYLEILKLVEIGRLYYEEEMTQAQVAKKMDISRPMVSKLLAEARRQGIVRIEIKSPLESDGNLLAQLKARFGLKDGLIVPVGSADENLMFRLIISQTARFLEQQLPDLKKIGLGWGHSIGALIDELRPMAPQNGNDGVVCPLMGSAPNAIKWFQPNELTRMFAEKTGYAPYYLHAPAFPMSAPNRQLFEDTDQYQQISSLWADLDAAVLGVGTYPSVPDQATAARFGGLLKERKAVGMIATYYYNREGELISGDNDIVIRIPLEFLRRAKRVYLISGGQKKISTTWGALRTGLVTHLVTDELTARRILESADSKDTA
jgi:deoxyribonucleoside regulator